MISFFELLILVAVAVVMHRVLFGRRVSAGGEIRQLAQGVRRIADHEKGWKFFALFLMFIVLTRWMGFPAFITYLGIACFLPVILVNVLSDKPAHRSRHLERTKAFAQQAPAPHWKIEREELQLPPEPPVHARPLPPPPSPPQPLHLPHHDEYPERKPGWFGAMVRVAGMFALFVLGIGFLSVSHREAIHPNTAMRAMANSDREIRLVGNEYAVPASDRTSTEPSLDWGIALDARRTAKLDLQSKPNAYGPRGGVYSVELSYLNQDTPLTLYTEEFANPNTAALQLEDMLIDFCREVVASRKKVSASFWKPSRAWIRETFQPFQIRSQADGNQDVQLTQLAVEIEPGDWLIESILQRFVGDQKTYRTIRLGQVYAGAVLMLGGLAIFLRLGTGRKPNAK